MIVLMKKAIINTINSISLIYSDRMSAFLSKSIYAPVICIFFSIGVFLSMFSGCSDSFEKQIIDPDLDRKSFLRIDAALCTACGECFKHCPNKAIEEKLLDNSTYVYIIDPDLCIRCGICTQKCLYGAIKWKR